VSAFALAGTGRDNPYCAGRAEWHEALAGCCLCWSAISRGVQTLELSSLYRWWHHGTSQLARRLLFWARRWVDMHMLELSIMIKATSAPEAASECLCVTRLAHYRAVSNIGQPCSLLLTGSGNGILASALTHASPGSLD
jgi:hypothetical protein